MPPRWPRQPDRSDPAFRRLDDRMNFATHVAVFAAINSGLWFFHQVNPLWVPWVDKFSLVWLVGLVAHGVYVFAIAHYSDSYTPKRDNASKEGS